MKQWMADIMVLLQLFWEFYWKSCTWTRNVASLMTFVNVLMILKSGMIIQTPREGKGELRGPCFYMMGSSCMVGGSWIVSYPVVYPRLCVSYWRGQRDNWSKRHELQGKGPWVCFRLVGMKWVENIWLFDHKKSYLKSPRFVCSPECFFLVIVPGKSCDIGKKMQFGLGKTGFSHDPTRFCFVGMGGLA